MFEFGKITSKHTNETVSVTYAWVGKGRKTVHMSPLDDETLCGRVISEYTDAAEGSEGVLCSRCWKSFKARETTEELTIMSNAEVLAYDEWSKSSVEVQGDVDVPASITTADGPIGEFDYDAYQEEPSTQHHYTDPCATCGEPSHNYNYPKCARCEAKEENNMTDPISRVFFPGAAGLIADIRETVADNTPDTGDAGFVETMVTQEYELSVIVDDVTGTRVSLGWVTLTMNATQCMDFDRVAEEYGRTQNTRTPRHGWASIITVHNACAL